MVRSIFWAEWWAAILPRGFSVALAISLGLITTCALAETLPDHCGCVTQWTAVTAVGLRPFNLFQAVDAKVLLAAADRCLQKSEDGGEHWRDIYCIGSAAPHFTAPPLGDLQALSRDEIWLLEGNHTLLHTVDGGLTWARQVFPELTWRRFRFHDSRTGWLVGERTVNDGDPDVVGAAAVTRDGGEHWQEVNLGVSLPYRWRLHSVWPATVESAWVMGDVALRTSDEGATWQPLSIASVDMTSPGRLSVQFRDNGFGWVRESRSVDLLITHDRGESWEQRTLPGGIATTMDMLPIGASAALLASSDLYCSEDSGQTWRTIFSSDPSAAVEHLWYVAGQDLVIASGGRPTLFVGRCIR